MLRGATLSPPSCARPQRRPHGTLAAVLDSLGSMQLLVPLYAGATTFLLVHGCCERGPGYRSGCRASQSLRLLPLAKLLMDPALATLALSSTVCHQNYDAIEFNGTYSLWQNDYRRFNNLLLVAFEIFAIILPALYVARYRPFFGKKPGLCLEKRSLGYPLNLALINLSFWLIF